MISRRFYEVLYELKWLRRLAPRWLKAFIRNHYPTWFYEYLRFSCAQSDPYPDDNEFIIEKGRYPYVLGIIKEFAHYHRYYIRACRELGVSYKVLDITGSDWIEVIRNSQCDAFLVWPSPIMTIWKQMYDERLKVMAYDMGKLIFPSYDELWMWESKRRMRDWLVAHDVPHPHTWIFYDFDEARQFLDTAQFPIVFKPDFGDCARGVRILRSKKEAMRIVKRMFTKGIRLPGAHPLDIQWGNVVFQEYLADVAEWRMVKIDNSYFGYEKLKVGMFHSGSGAFRHSMPKLELLDFVKSICEKTGFQSMNIDVFVTSNGRFLVSELQSLFGMSHPVEQCVVDGNPGRMVYDESKKTWRFEKGEFCGNQLCNLRVECVLKMLAANRAAPETDSSDIPV